MSWLELYCTKVLDGEIVACLKVKSLCGRLLSYIREGVGDYVFDEEAANRPVEFIETFCMMPSGRMGQPLLLELYEKAWIQSIFGFVHRDTGLRMVREAFIEVGRKNGKTSLMAALELYMLTSDGEGAPQVYNAANTEPQAELGYNAMLRMLRQSPDLCAHVRKQADRTYCDLNMGYIRPISSRPTGLDGFDVHFGVIDEIHAAKTRDVYDLLVQGTAAREQPLIIQITTNGFVRNSIFDDQYDYAARWLAGEVENLGFVAWIYELDDREEWLDESCWMKPNPGLGTVKKLEYLRGQVRKAKDDPAYRPTVLTKDFDMPANQSTAWLSFEEAVNPEVVDFSQMGFRYGVCGFDAADSVDLTAAQLMLMRPGDDRIYERSMYWMPEDVVMEQADSGREKDFAPYRLWAARGLCRLVPGNKVDKGVLVDWLAELRDEEDLYTYAVFYDPWHVDDSTKRSLELLVGASRCFKVRQGAQTLSQPMKQIRADYMANRIVDNHNPINEWCRMNVAVRADVNGNIQPDKKSLDPRNRIDGFVAEVCAYKGLYDLWDDYSMCI